MDELGFLYSYTPAYSPQYNGIEEVFSMAKKKIKMERLRILLRNEQEDLRKIIFEAFDGINIQHIAKCISRSLKLLGLDEE